MKILLVEDHPIVRLGLNQLIKDRWNIARIEEAETLKQALEHVHRDVYDVVISDLNLADAKGLDGLERLLKEAPEQRVLVLSLNEESAYAARALQMGAYGYLEKNRASEELIVAIESILANRRYITASQGDRLVRQMAGEMHGPAHDKLTPQEFRVMTLLAGGLRLTEIGHAMNLSPKTVTTYRSRVLEKLQLFNNSDLLRYCLEHALLK